MMSLAIPRAIFDEVIDHCRRGLPNEACGFLGGSGEAVERIYPLENAAASPVYYRPNDRQMLAAMNDIDERGLKLLAIFHSHVASKPYPSVTDVREAHYPDTVYLIVGMSNEPPTAKGYYIHKDDWRDPEGRIEEIDLVLS